jgi:hypothetical protein
MKYGIALNAKYHQISNLCFRGMQTLIAIIFQVHYGFNCGSGSALIMSEKAYHDGQWHTVVFSRVQTNGKLVIDGENAGEGSSKGTTKSMNIVSPYYIGGISPNISSDAKFNIKVRIFSTALLPSVTYHI